MSSKIFLAVLLVFVFVFLLTEMQPIQTVRANFLPKEIPTPPTIVIHSPLNTTYNQNDLVLNFTIVGISHWWTIAYHITDLYYEIDGKVISLYVDSHANNEQYSTNIVGLANGQHTLTIHANASGVYRNNYPNSGTAIYSVESKQTAIFIIDKELENTPSTLASTSLSPIITAATPSTLPTTNLTPSLTPSSTPTITPTSSPTQQPTPTASAIPYYGVDYTPRLIIVSLVTLAVVVGLLVYFKKRR